LGALSLRLSGAYGHHALSTDRRVSYSGLSEHLEAQYDATSVQAMAEAIWRLETAPSDVEPYARLAYVQIDTDRAAETGGMTALAGKAGGMETLTSTLGLRAGDTIRLGGAEAYLTAQLGWRHAYGDLTPDAVMMFEGGDAFRVSGVAYSRDAAEIGAGATFAVSDRTDVTAGYSGVLGDTADHHSLTLRMRIEF
jgi:outer membrane autotransporter protein